MKLRSTRTSATYTLPDPGELNRRIKLRLREDMPGDDYGSEPVYRVDRGAWAKIDQVGATTLRESVQVDNIVTHNITIRYRREITSDYEVVDDLGIVYRVKRQRDLNNERRFLLLECEELGVYPDSGGGNDTTIFAR